MNQKDENWDFDGEGHRGKKYPSGAPVAYLVLSLIIVVPAICYFVFRFLMSF